MSRLSSMWLITSLALWLASYCFSFAAETASVAYVPSTSNGSVKEFRVGQDGSLSPLDAHFSKVSDGKGGRKVFLDLQQKFAYVCNEDDNTISQYRVRGDGGLEPLSPPVVSVSGSRPVQIVLHPSGNFAYVLHGRETSANIDQFRIATGRLIPLAPPTISTGESNATRLVFDKTGEYAYSANNKGAVLQYKVMQNGMLSPLSQNGPNTGAATADMISDASGRFVYICTMHTDADAPPDYLYQYKILTDGHLAALTPARVDAPHLGAFIFSNSAKRTLYLRGDSAIYQYRIGDDGGLLPLSPFKVQCDDGTNLAFHPDLPMAYANDVEGRIAVYHVAAEGQLTALSGFSVNTGHQGTQAVTLAPDGKTLYAVNNIDGTISQFAIQQNGMLKPLSPPAVDCGSGSYFLTLARPPAP